MSAAESSSSSALERIRALLPGVLTDPGMADIPYGSTDPLDALLGHFARLLLKGTGPKKNATDDAENDDAENDDSTQSLEALIDNLHHYIDPWRTTTDFLPYLASWVDVDVPPGLSNYAIRKLIADADWQRRRAGTRDAVIEDLLRTTTPLPAISPQDVYIDEGQTVVAGEIPKGGGAETELLHEHVLYYHEIWRGLQEVSNVVYLSVFDNNLFLASDSALFYNTETFSHIDKLQTHRIGATTKSVNLGQIEQGFSYKDGDVIRYFVVYRNLTATSKILLLHAAENHRFNHRTTETNQNGVEEEVDDPRILVESIGSIAHYCVLPHWSGPNGEVKAILLKQKKKGSPLDAFNIQPKDGKWDRNPTSSGKIDVYEEEDFIDASVGNGAMTQVENNSRIALILKGKKEGEIDHYRIILRKYDQDWLTPQALKFDQPMALPVNQSMLRICADRNELFILIRKQDGGGLVHRYWIDRPDKPQLIRLRRAFNPTGIGIYYQDGQRHLLISDQGNSPDRSGPFEIHYSIDGGMSVCNAAGIVYGNSKETG